MTQLPERNLDVLRAFAVLAVLVDHTVLSAGIHGPSIEPFVQWLGQAGVYAFFVHTSLVLMGSLERDHAPERAHWIRRFYIRRAFRIYPLALAVMAVVIIGRVPWALIPASYVAPTRPAILTNLLLVQDLFGHTPLLVVLWTLPLELQMYLALPLCYRIARRASWWGMAALLAAGVALALAYGWGTTGGHYVKGLWRLDVLNFIPCFLMGVVAYWLFRRAPRTVIPAAVWPLVIPSLMIAGGFVFIRTEQWFWLRTIFCAALGFAVPFVREARSSMMTKTAHTIATYSYGIYLLHMLALRAGFTLVAPRFVQWAVFLGTLVLSCFAGYHLIEKPGIALGRWVIDRTMRGRAIAGAEPSTVPAAP